MSKSEITVPAPSNDVEPHRSLTGTIQVDGLEAERDSATLAPLIDYDKVKIALAVRLSSASQDECLAAYRLAMRMHKYHHDQSIWVRECLCAAVRRKPQEYGVQHSDRWAYKCPCLQFAAAEQRTSREQFYKANLWRDRWLYLSAQPRHPEQSATRSGPDH